MYGGRLIDMLATANGGAPELPAEVGASLPLPPGPVSPAVLGAAFGNRDNFRFQHHGATSVARAARAVEARVDAQPTRARPRKVQVDVFREAMKAPRGAGAFTKPVRGHLQADTQYQVEVSVRFPKQGKLQAGTVIDLSALPQDQNPHWLTVTFQELESDAPAQQGNYTSAGDPVIGVLKEGSYRQVGRWSNRLPAWSRFGQRGARPRWPARIDAHRKPIHGRPMRFEWRRR